MTDQFQPTARDPHPGAPSDETGDATGVESMTTGGGRPETPGASPAESYADAGLTPHVQPAEGGREEADDDIPRDVPG
jgi:hypothetical protein